MAQLAPQGVGRALAAAAVALVLALAGVGIAPAVPALAATSCPAAPADYTGSDQTLDELRDTRIDAAATCQATSERLDELSDSLSDVQSAITAARTTDTVSLSATDREQAEDIQGAFHADLWFVAGLLAATLAGGIVAREFLWH